MRKWVFIGLSFLCMISGVTEDDKTRAIIYLIGTLILMGIAFIFEQLENIFKQNKQ